MRLRYTERVIFFLKKSANDVTCNTLFPAPDSRGDSNQPAHLLKNHVQHCHLVDVDVK